MSAPLTALLSVEPQLTRFDQRRWVLQCPSGHQLLLNEAGADLLHLVAAAPTFLAGCAHFNTRYATALSLPEFEQLVQRQFGGYRLLADEQCPPRPPASAPLQFRLQLLSPKWAGWLASPFVGLFTPAIFWPLLAAVGIGLAIYYMVQPAALTLPSGAGMVGLVYGSFLVHELGHIAACRRAGLAHGGIGVGLYLLVPVFYADITAIWQGSRQQRIVANLGGIFTQLLYAAALASVGLACHAPAWLLSAQVVAVSALWQFNPFIRHDGYWLLADLSNTPNLLAEAGRVRQRVLSRQLLPALRAGRLAKLVGPAQGWLLAYGLINISLVAVLMALLLWQAGPAILQLPSLLYTLLQKLLQGSLTKQDFHAKTVTVLAFYGLLLRLAMPHLTRFFHKLRKTR
jgi:putative peptide zinc metalloprotease protein